MNYESHAAVLPEVIVPEQKAVSEQKTVEHRSRNGHLLYLDSIRGLAALYVLAHHIYLQSGFRWTDGEYYGLFRWLAYGHAAVVVFIVLSGYCLMMPVCKYGEVRGGTKNFYYRRARRILPPYYCAFIISLLLICICPVLRENSRTLWDAALPPFGVGSILSHFFLIHDLNSKWCFTINPPLWSVAVEFQIYLLFPIILVPLFKKWGSLVLVPTSFLVGLFPVIALHRFEGACPWFLGLFALGMVVAAGNFTSVSRRYWKEASLVLALVFFVAYVLMNSRYSEFEYSYFYVTDIVVGISFAFFLYWLGEIVVRDSKNDLIVKLLESKLLVGLGVASYSLYLLHMPVVALADGFIRGFGFSPLMHFSILCAIAGGGCIALARLFFVLVESRFLNVRVKPQQTQ